MEKKYGIFIGGELVYVAEENFEDEGMCREMIWDECEMEGYADETEETLTVQEEVWYLRKALAECIDIILNNGEEPNELARLTGLEDCAELRNLYIGKEKK